MRAKEYLMQVRMLDRKIEHRREELARLKEKATSVGSVMSDGGRVQTSPSADGKTRIVDRYIDLEREIDGMLLELCDKREIGRAHV